jgi:hypothetical protein
LEERKIWVFGRGSGR